MNKLSPLLFIIAVCLVFFYQFFAKGLLPLPSDTIIGLYHPFRDLYAKDYPRGIPFKNFLITDPVRQQYPWKQLVISAEKKMQLPLWNPYNFAGTPLLANLQSAAFYPMNLFFFVLPFNLAWSFLIFLGPLLAGIFLYLYLSNLKLSKEASILGAIAFSFSGFFSAWLEWGNIQHAALWLPLILLSIDKIVSSNKYQVISIRNKKLILWCSVYLASLVSSFLAGHLQTFFYLFAFSIVYFFARWSKSVRSKKIVFTYILLNASFIILTSIQWIPTLQFILQSARNVDVIGWKIEGWFIPWQNLIQFIAPDFFGNPATLNYFGVWNYAEFVGYVGIVPLIFSIFALFFRRDKKTLFFGTAFFISLIFALPTFVAKIPFLLNIPFIDTAQPTRLLFITDFSLSVLAALGFDYFKKSGKGIFYCLGFAALILLSLWGFVFFGEGYMLTENLLVAKHNLLLPTLIFVAFVIIIILYFVLATKTKRKIVLESLVYLFILIVVFDLLRFSLKFNPFTKRDYLFPPTSAIAFLQKNIGNYRIMTTDARMLPPNFSAVYKLQSIDGYDPLYLRRYAELVAASERGKPNINPPFGFNRIINPHNYQSEIINLLGVKYVLSLTDINDSDFIKVFQEGETRVYENKKVLPRAFFVGEVIEEADKKNEMDKLFEKQESLDSIAIVEGLVSSNKFELGTARITKYEDNKVLIETENKGEGFMVLTDTFYPAWVGKIDGKETKIYLTDLNLRGIVVPAGKHSIEFSVKLF